MLFLKNLKCFIPYVQSSYQVRKIAAAPTAMSSPEGNITCEGNIARKSDIILHCTRNMITDVTSEGNSTSEGYITKYSDRILPCTRCILD